MPPPAATVVVPTRDRPERLQSLLRSLELQDTAAPFEVIVVDDASERPTTLPTLLEAAPGLDLRLLRHDAPRGPAATRNTGWRAARAPFVAFTDDDCEATPGWLGALLAAAEGDGDVIVQGRTEPHPAEADRIGPFSRTVAIGGADELYETCNLAVPRSLLQRIGGFDESFRNACGEDVDLGRRGVKSGARLVYAQDALVYHAVHQPGVLGTVRGTPIWTDAVRVLKLHPELRRMLVHRLFWKRSHAPLLLALAGLALAGRRGSFAWLALVLPYVDHHRRAHSAAGRPLSTAVRSLPGHLAVDSTELLTMVRGSLKHRTLML